MECIRKSRRDEIIVEAVITNNENPEGMTLLLTITKPRRGDISLKKIKKHASQVGWISEAHPPLKITTVIVHKAKKQLHHSARREKPPLSFCTERSAVAESPA